MYVDPTPAIRGINEICFSRAESDPSPPSLGSVDANVHAYSIAQRQLQELSYGYIWVIPTPGKYFAADQRSDVFSDPFTLSGQRWELRFCSADEDHLNVFLKPLGHTQRLDFRVVAFAPNVWHVREANGWSEAFAGKGWGIRPYCRRAQMLATFVHDNVVKICVTPLGALY